MTLTRSSTAGTGPSWYATLTLAQRFLLVGGMVMLIAMLLMGSWVSNRIEHGVVANTANAAALYMESVISPVSQELARSDVLSPNAIRALDEIFGETPIGERVVSYKIWKAGGLVAHASNAELIGRTFEPSEDLRAAWQGRVHASFADLDDGEAAAERALGVPLLEVYSPVREIWSGKIIAVAEFYEIATELEQELLRARVTTWIVVAAVMLSASVLLFGIVLNGSRTISRQQGALTNRVRELARLVEQNRELRQRIERASGRTTEMNERYLRRISADLHDGPAQLLAFASLRLDRLADATDRKVRDGEAETIRNNLDQAMADIRSICRGLALPEIDADSIETIVRRAVTDHQGRTGDAVAVITRGLDDVELGHSRKICVFRFIQEALSNASRHGQGWDIRVEAQGRRGGLEIAINDSGPGFDIGAAEDPEGKGLGLRGLRNRIESQGGQLEVATSPGNGTQLRLIFEDLEEG